MKKCQRTAIVVAIFMLAMAVSADAVQRMVMFENQTNTA